MYHKLQLILFALKKLEVETKQPTHPFYTSLAARKIKDAVELIKESLEMVKK
jgi:ribosomal protein L31